MSSLTVDPNFKIESRPDVLILSNAQAIIFICPRCTKTRNVYLHHEQAADDVLAGSVGATVHPMFQQCQCLTNDMVEQNLHDIVEEVLHRVRDRARFRRGDDGA